MGLVIIGAVALYLLVSVGIVIWAVRYARKHKKNTKLWGGGAALVMYLLVFWDHLPTVVAHEYYCEAEAGFWAYKTVGEWKEENIGVVEALVATKGASSVREGDMHNYTDTYVLNQRLNLVTKHSGKLAFNVWRWEKEIVDSMNGETLYRYVDFSTSQEQKQAGWSGWKFWLQDDHCDEGRKNRSSIYEIVGNLSKLLGGDVK